MYVLTIQEPYATAIAKRFKTKETRSWKPADKYIGETLFIQAAKKNHPSLKENEWLKEFTDDNLGELNNGNIICKVKLDHVEKTEESDVSELERKLGFYEPGRYAWCFTEVEEINPIKVKGKLGVWNYEL